MTRALRVLIVEDDVLPMMQLEIYLEAAGHTVVGTALSSREAMEVATGLEADIALVDVHLADGPTGLDVGRFLAERTTIAVVFMTANPKRLPDDFAGAIGVIPKPYTQEGIYAAFGYLAGAMLASSPPRQLPRSLMLSPSRTQTGTEVDTAPL